jgi:hypothetical protein
VNSILSFASNVRIGMENKRLTALLIAILVTEGRVTIPARIAEKEWEGASLKSVVNPDGSVSLWVEGAH